MNEIYLYKNFTQFSALELHEGKAYDNHIQIQHDKTIVNTHKNNTSITTNKINTHSTTPKHNKYINAN